MTHKEFLQKAENPSIKAITSEGQVLDCMVISKKRSSLKKIKDICKRRLTGEIQFVDYAEFHVIEAAKIKQIRLYYGNILVGLRIVPTIYLLPDDKLSLTFGVSIISDASTVMVN